MTDSSRRSTASGSDPGERIAIVSPNSAKFLIALWAAIGSGRVLVPINFRLGADEVAYIVPGRGGLAALFGPERERPRLEFGQVGERGFDRELWRCGTRTATGWRERPDAAKACAASP